MRASYEGLLEEGTAPLEDHPDGVQWHTFAGGAVNRLLAAGLEERTGKKWVAGNLSLRCKDVPVTAASDAIRALADLDWESVAAAAARDMARGMLSKFQPCLPEEAEDRLLAERLLDQPATLRFLASVKVNGVRIAARPGGIRLADVEATGPMLLEFARPAQAGPVATPRNEVQWVDTPAALRAVSEELRERRCRWTRCRDRPRLRNAVPPPDRDSQAHVSRRPVRRRRFEADRRRVERHAAGQGHPQRALRASRPGCDRHRAGRSLRHAGSLSPSARR